MSAILEPIFSLFRYHKLKMLGVLLFALFFFVVLFPKQDLSDWVAAKVTQATGIYMRFDELGFAFTPTPGISATNVLVEPPGVPAVKAGSIEAAPIFSKIITAKAGLSATATDLFKGSVDIDYGQGSGTTHEIDVNAQGVSLDELGDFLRSANMMSMKLQGVLDLVAALNVDQTFQQQPVGTVNLRIPTFVFPGQEIQANMNGVMVPLALPTVNVGKLELNAKLGDRQLEIVNMDIGGPRNDLAGKMKGSIGMNLMPTPAGVQPQVSKIELRMDVTLNKDFVARTPMLTSMMGMITEPACKQNTDKGLRINCLVTMMPGNPFPSFKPLTEKL